MSITLHGRIFLSFDIKLVSGLHIGGTPSALEIGGVDKPVIRNVVTNRPYIPGSSLKGKLRSLTEKAYGAPQNYDINNIKIHTAHNAVEYSRYPISRIFGTLPEIKNSQKQEAFVASTPTRLTVRDTPLSDESVVLLEKLRTDLPYTEIKWEAAIDRVTSAATPRQIERVPAGAVFGPAELVYSVYVGDDEEAPEVARWFKHVIEALDYLEDDYLGGMGTRGNGRVKFTDLKLETRRVSDQGYGERTPIELGADSVAEIDKDALAEALATRFA